MIKLLGPADGEVFSITSDIYKEFRKRDLAGEHKNDRSLEESLNEYYDGVSYGSAPVTLRLSWKTTDADAENKLKLRLKGESCPSAAIATVSEVKKGEDGIFFAEVTNLLSGEEYVWSVDGSEERGFSTVRGEMRFINADGYANIRDAGGRLTVEGKRIRQGLVYRGVGLDNYDDLHEGDREIGKKVFRETLGIKCDIDLRSEAVGKLTESPLGKDVRFKLIPFDAYGATLNDVGRGVLRRVLELFADEENYPIYYHCYAGADRTGTIGAYLDAILGMSDAEIIFNYNVTSLSPNNERCWYDGDCKTFIEFLDETYPNHSIGELLMINLRLSGISEETIEKIREIMLEK